MMGPVVVASHYIELRAEILSEIQHQNVVNGTIVIKVFSINYKLYLLHKLTSQNPYGYLSIFVLSFHKSEIKTYCI